MLGAFVKVNQCLAFVVAGNVARLRHVRGTLSCSWHNQASSPPSRPLTPSTPPPLLPYSLLHFPPELSTKLHPSPPKVLCLPQLPSQSSSLSREPQFSSHELQKRTSSPLFHTVQSFFELFGNPSLTSQAHRNASPEILSFKHFTIVIVSLGTDSLPQLTSEARG